MANQLLHFSLLRAFSGHRPSIVDFKENLSFYISGLRVATKESFLCFMQEECGFECIPGPGLNPTFKMAVIAKFLFFLK